ncbi:hypothetical protein [Mycobacterium sp.]|uniref:hypothetical protein n=1 Tax=Mycobacterium sp. TaxID=1785 RepID=UPI001285E3E2|nr:hypothetical protein [Mycobacterium sp.]KAA8959852.1 MAG: hypothetical protein F6Q13_14350 [Mycobacterium sp.]
MTTRSPGNAKPPRPETAGDEQTRETHSCDHDAIIKAHVREYSAMVNNHLAKLKALTDRHLAEHHDIARRGELSTKEYESVGARHLNERRKLTEQMLQDHHKLAERHLSEVGALWTRHSRQRLHNLGVAKKAAGG